MAQQLSEFFKKLAPGRGVMVADKLAVMLRKVLSVRARTRRTLTGKVVAAEPAIPFAPPRYVTGILSKSVKVRRTARGALLQIFAPYAVPLERGKKWYGWPHQSLARALRDLKIKGRSA